MLKRLSWASSPGYRLRRENSRTGSIQGCELQYDITSWEHWEVNEVVMGCDMIGKQNRGSRRAYFQDWELVMTWQHEAKSMDTVMWIQLSAQITDANVANHNNSGLCSCPFPMSGKPINHGNWKSIKADNNHEQIVSLGRRSGTDKMADDLI